MIIDLTNKAKEELKKILESKKTEKPLRIYITGYGWGGPSFGLALDEQKDTDNKFEVEEFTFLLEKGLEESFPKFTIDYSDNWLRRGFTVISSENSGGC